MNYEIKWDSQMEGLEISFTVEGELHRSLLSWTRLEEMRQEMVRDIWKLVPKITEGVGSTQLTRAHGDCVCTCGAPAAACCDPHCTWRKPNDAS
jgi:hypothetical protein